MKRKNSQRGGKWYLILVPLAHGYLVLAALILSLLIAVQIILNANVLKAFTIPLLFLYLGALVAVIYLLKRRRDLIDEHAALGDEMFYELYPAEKRREERRAARRAKEKARREARQAKAAEKEFGL